jgi:hypothetical protein
MTRPGSTLVDPQMLRRLRGVAVRSLTGAAVVTRPGTGEPTYDPDTGHATYPPEVHVFTGPCRVQPANTGERTLMLADVETTVRRYAIHLPHVADVQLGDTVTVTQAPDPELVGQRLHVVDVLPSTLPVLRVVTGIDVDDLGSWRQ